MFELAKQKLQVARKLRDKNATVALQCLIGDVQTAGDTSNEKIVEVARSHIKALNFSIEKSMEKNIEVDGLKAQVEALQFVMPPSLDDATIKELIADAQHIGEAMKTVRAHCQEHGFEFDGAQVKWYFVHR